MARKTSFKISTVTNKEHEVQKIMRVEKGKEAKGVMFLSFFLREERKQRKGERK